VVIKIVLTVLVTYDDDDDEKKNLERLNMATNFRPRLRASLKPSEKRITSAISSLSGLDIATGRNSCFRLSGNFCRPPYPFPAGFIVMKIPEFGSTLTCSEIKKNRQSNPNKFLS